MLKLSIVAKKGGSTSIVDSDITINPISNKASLVPYLETNKENSSPDDSSTWVNITNVYSNYGLLKTGWRTTDTILFITGQAEADSLVTIFDSYTKKEYGSTKTDSSGNWALTTATITPAPNLDGWVNITAKVFTPFGNATKSNGVALRLIPSSPDLAVNSDPTTDDGNIASGDEAKDNIVTLTERREEVRTIEAYDSNHDHTWLGIVGSDDRWPITLPQLSDQVFSLLSLAKSNSASTIYAPSGTLKDGIVSLGNASVDNNQDWHVNPRPLQNSKQSVQAFFTDHASNKATSKVSALTIFIDQFIQTDQGQASAGSTANDDTVRISGSGPKGAIVSIYDGSTLLGTTTVGNGLTWSYDTEALSEGKHSVSASIVNNGKVETSKPLNFNIDTTATQKPDHPWDNQSGWGKIDALKSYSQLLKTDLAQNDTNTSGYSKGLLLANINDLNNMGITGKGVKIAILDSGIDLNNAEFSGRISKDSRNYLSANSSIQDDNGHGTSVASFIGAANDGKGLTGGAYDAELMICKIADAFGKATLGSLVSAIYDAAKKGASIINISYGLENPSPLAKTLIEEAVAFAVSKGCLVFSAAGNNAGAKPSTPAEYAKEQSNAFAVGSYEGTVLSSFSNRAGSDVPYGFISAYGGLDTTYGLDSKISLLSGTSFAAPIVATQAALLLSSGLGLTQTQVAKAIINGSKSLKDESTTTTPQKNLIKNGNFNNDQFSTDLAKVAAFSDYGQCTVTKTAPEWGLGASRGIDGSLFLMVDGGNNPNAKVWYQDVNLKAGKNYEFSYFSMGNDFNPAKLQVKINGESVGYLNTIHTATGWEKHTVRFTTSNTQTAAQISIINLETAPDGNDFGLDNISLIETSEKIEKTVFVNLITNGGFDTDLFSTGLTKVKALSDYGQCTVTNTAPAWGLGASKGINGSAFLMVDGGSNPDAKVWYQEVDVKTETDYEFSYFSMGNDQNAAKLQVKVDGVNIGSVNTVYAAGGWEKHTVRFTTSSTKNKAEISIFNLERAPAGNDFGLDNISLIEKPANPNLITNGSFNTDLFSTDLAKVKAFYDYGQCIVTNTAPAWGLGASKGINGSAFLMVDGGSNPNAKVWYQDVDVKANTDYEFGYCSMGNDWNRARLQVQIDGVSVGSVNTVYAATGWEQQKFHFKTGKTTTRVQVGIVNLETAPAGNDFGLDNISLIEKPAYPNLIANGDFITEHFSTDLAKVKAFSDYGQCIVTNTAPEWGLGAVRGINGSAFLMVDGSSNPNTRVWYQDVTVKESTNYEFSYFSMGNAQNPAKLQVKIDGVSVGSVKTFYTATDWEEHSVRFTTSSTKNKVQISIINLETAPAGNDFGVDNIALIEKPACPDLITDGYFNTDLFSTDLAKVKALSDYGQCTITNKPPAWGLGASTGIWGSSFLMVDGGNDPNARVWYQDVDVKAGTNYEFGYCSMGNAQNPAKLLVKIDGQRVGEVNTIDANAPGWQGHVGWERHIVHFTTSSTQTKIQICIVNLETAPAGNDFGLDSFSLYERFSNQAVI